MIFQEHVVATKVKRISWWCWLSKKNKETTQLELFQILLTANGGYTKFKIIKCQQCFSLTAGLWCTLSSIGKRLLGSGNCPFLPSFRIIGGTGMLAFCAAKLAGWGGPLPIISLCLRLPAFTSCSKRQNHASWVPAGTVGMIKKTSNC